MVDIGKGADHDGRRINIERSSSGHNDRYECSDRRKGNHRIQLPHRSRCRYSWRCITKRYPVIIGDKVLIGANAVVLEE